MSNSKNTPQPITLISQNWKDYELLDTGAGQKLERFGEYTFIRPEPQAMWQPALPEKAWKGVHAIFQGGDEEELGSKWEFKDNVPDQWQMHYKDISFWAEATPFRHMGIFPEHVSQWDWMAGQVKSAGRPVRILNLFAYTGLSTLALAEAGAQVTHVDASKKVIGWARDNQALSKLENRPIRWIIDDALKFTQREARRGVKYDGLVIDPPKFGRGPKGEIWKLHESLPILLDSCKEILSESPIFTVLTTYAVKTSALSLYYLLDDLLSQHNGELEIGEMALCEKSAGRLLSTATFARWRSRSGTK
jgi:23S rRNA (cytosine1962-C5)-methyltransferase